MLITLENVGKSWGIDVILQKINAVVNEGDRIGIIGENGAGKTTLLNLLMGVLENDEGDIIFDDNATVGYLRQMDGLNLENTIYQEMQTVFQPVYDAINECAEIEKQLTFTPDNQALIERHHSLQNLIYSKDGYNTDFLIKKMLGGMGFKEEEYTKVVKVLSGGERTRLNLAKLLLENPDILILDEPTNHLDFDTLVWLEDYLISYKGAIIAVSHDRFFLDKVVKKIWEVEDTLLTEYKGNYSAFDVQKQEKLKVQQRQYEADMEKAAKLQDYVDRNLVRASTTKMAQSRRKQLEKMEITEKPKPLRVPLKFTFDFDVKPYDEILTIENLTVATGNRTLIQDLNVVVRRGQRLIIAGANGSGKTTLINTITGKIRPKEGRIKLGQGAVPATFDQHITVGSSTVIDTIWALRPKWTQLEVRSYLARFGYRGEDVFKECYTLSGGERARLRFCEMSLDRANIMFLDEPTNHLDIYMRRAVTEALSKYEGTILVVTHDRFLMQQLDCPIMNIEGGKGVFYENFEDFMAKHKSEGFNTKQTQPKTDKTEKPNNYVANQKEARRQAAADRLRMRECERDIECLHNEWENQVSRVGRI
ncbi:MAG: ABC-F family ATP-binding cassette domain-containing protein [Oscillospiraceae bacterium]|nr:ABC-F family ATP-binding cassette domain-containing protein [Oscillospiraceae bacterium]